MKKILIIFAIVLTLIFLIKAVFWNNIDFLCVMAGASGKPSAFHNFFMDRIYKIAERRDISKILIDNLRKDNKEALHGLFLRILGVIGEKNALNDFMSIYFKHQDENKSLVLYYVLNSIGLLGEEKAVIFLENIINRKGQWDLLNYSIAESLYLLTGKKYDFINPKGDMQDFYPTDEVLRARDVILATKDRKRSFQEMIILDILFSR